MITFALCPACKAYCPFAGPMFREPSTPGTGVLYPNFTCSRCWSTRVMNEHCGIVYLNARRAK